MRPESSQTAGAPPTRRARKKARTRREIYEAAMALFRARGYDAVTVEDVCRAADVARGTFFLHFPTKDAVLAEYGAQVNAELAERLRLHRGGAADALRAALAFLAGRAAAHAPLVERMVRDVMTRPGALAHATTQSRDTLDLLAGVVRGGQARRELRADVEPTLAAGVVLAAYFGIVSEWARQGGAVPLGPAVAQAVDLVLGGLAAPAAAPKRRR